MTTRAIALASLLLTAAPARAQPPLHLVVEGDVDSEHLRAALERELGHAVVLGDGAPPRLVAEVESGRAALSFVASTGDERRRELEVSDDGPERTRELALVASNLVRDQASALIAPASKIGSSGNDERVASSAAADVSSTPSNLALEHPFHLGASGLFGLVVDDDGTGSNVRPFGGYGLSLTGTVDRMVSIGLTRLALNFGYSSLEGEIFSFEGTPIVELFAFLDPRVQLYGQLGVAIQGTAATAIRDGFVGVAPFVGGGVRFWLADWFTIGLELGLHFVVTDGYRVSSIELPQWSLPGTLGLSAEFHVR